LIIIGQILFLTARSQNDFFSSVVRIQKDRGHVVCDTGLYKIVRHPGYLGMIISLMALPLITTSIWSIIPTLIAIVLLLIRTSLEDKTLINELDGYVEYTKKTQNKLIPFVW
jgi:protein-S-isoprenylcysteine O-methyltransferase Ste14